MTTDHVIHQALFERIFGLKVGSIYCRQIAAYRNGEGVSLWTGKRFYPELVFGVIRKALMKAQFMADAMAIPEIRVGINHLN